MKIKLTLSASESEKTLTITHEDIGYDEETWNEMSQEEKEQEIHDYVNSMSEQPFWVLEDHDVI